MTEQEIEEVLKDTYKIRISVKWRDFRIYDIFFSFKFNNEEIMGSCVALYDVKSTKEANIHNIINKIDHEISKIFKKEEE